MSGRREHRRVGYAAAVAATAVTVLVRWLCWPVIGDAVPHQSFFPAVLLAAYFGGLRPGLLATVLGAVVANVVLTPPYLTFGIKSVNAAAALPLFLSTGFMISAVCESLHRTRDRLLAEERRRAGDALRESEARFRAAFESAAVGVAYCDLHGRYLRVNQRLCDILGYTREELLGKTFLGLTHPDDMPRALARFGALVCGGSPSYTHEKRQVRRDGVSVWTHATVSLQRGEDGAPLHSLAFIEDVSERKRLEEELRRAKEAAEAANRAKDDFLANVSHEIRTPMTAVLGVTELLLEAETAEDRRRWLGTIKSAADGLLRVINDLLDFAKIEAGRLELEAADFSPRDAAVDALRALAPRARQKGLELRCQVADGVPETVVGDAGRLRQVLLNLAGNAVKFTHAGGVVVRVEAEPGPGEVALRFTVTDTGVGIAPEVRGRIFRAFEQADASTTRKYGGTGLGLSIASRLVALMGGTITVDSEVGRGSTFTFSARFRLAEGPAPHPEPPATTDAGPPLRVLVAEDNEFNSMMIEELLARRGHRVTLARDGREALRLASAGGFDVLLLDVHMPEMDGFEVIRAVRERERVAGGHLPAVALTARSLPEDRERCLAAGMDEFLSKPVRPADLLATMARVTRRPAPPLLLTASALLAACDGDAGLLGRLCGRFRERVPEHLAALAAAREAHDLGRLRETAHQLCGMLSVFSTPAGELASAAEDAAAAGEPGAFALAARVEEAVAELLRRTDGLTLADLRSLADRPA